LKRPNDRTQFAAVVKIAHDLGFKIVSYQILGLPNEDLDSMIETTVFQASLPVLIGASPYYVTPGCELTTTPTTSLSSTDFMTSRLTAMSDETAYFDREDIYTLFIIIRMINFLKGISLGNERADLTEIMDGAKKEGKRSALGADLLNRVFHEGILYSAGKRGFQKNRRFKTKLFTRVWNCLENISTQEGKIIEINR
jgi:radical SAM superfamily enzyme YgiQ (UPF0313 family)